MFIRLCVVWCLFSVALILFVSFLGCGSVIPCVVLGLLDVLLIVDCLLWLLMLLTFGVLDGLVVVWFGRLYYLRLVLCL